MKSEASSFYSSLFFLSVRLPVSLLHLLFVLAFMFFVKLSIKIILKIVTIFKPDFQMEDALK